jgi:hypothetical protein
MAQSATVLKAGPLTVRSSKVLDRRTAAERVISSPSTRYAFTGLQEGEKLSIAGHHPEECSLVRAEDGSDSVDISGLSALVFFEQTPYMAVIDLPDAEEAHIFSPLASWCEAADWDKKAHRLAIPINFGNDLGDFELCWEWIDEYGVRRSGSIRAQVFSFKLDIRTHFLWMIDDVSERFNWLQLDLLRQTAWGWSRSSDREADYKTWILIFQEVRRAMESGFRKLIKQHRRRLVPDRRQLRAESIRKFSPRLEERVAEGLLQYHDRRYGVEKKRLSENTPENRYMKHILLHTLAALCELSDRLEEVPRISDVFKDRLREWVQEWQQLLRHHFWKGIGAHHGLKKESLVLSQDPVYASIRRSWFWLKQGLVFLDQDLKGGIQNVSQLYEIWCLAQIDRILSESLGWIPQDMETVEESAGKDGVADEEVRSQAMRLRYRWKADDRIILDVLFQPTAAGKVRRDGLWDGVVSMPSVQRPDIVLRLHRVDLPHNPVYTWIFDAKYRIDGSGAPEDSVNEMHRYRDAILWAADAGLGASAKPVRESIGAYVLYPGNEDSSSKQLNSIAKVNIGAFPLMPAEGKAFKGEALKNHIKQLFQISQDFQGVMDREAQYYSVVPEAKKPLAGTIAICTVRHDELDVEEYWSSCTLYRLPLSQAEKLPVGPELLDFIVPQGWQGMQYGLFPVKGFEILTRREIVGKYDAAGVRISCRGKTPDRQYVLFSLGKRLPLPDNLASLPKRKVFQIVELD